MTLLPGTPLSGDSCRFNFFSFYKLTPSNIVIRKNTPRVRLLGVRAMVRMWTRTRTTRLNSNTIRRMARKANTRTQIPRETVPSSLMAEMARPRPASSRKVSQLIVPENAQNKCIDLLSSLIGIIYFFFRGRVGIDHPERVSDVARSYFILRPIPKDSKLGEGPIGDAGNSRLVAIPKKVFPQSGRERWIAFVEKTDISFDQLRDEFLASNDYVTKTAGTRHTPAATPIAEGVYAITTTGRESHLAYMLTLPERLGEVQTDLGLKEKGSWIVSTRNPQYPAPPNTQLPQGPEFSKEVSHMTG